MYKFKASVGAFCYNHRILIIIISTILFIAVAIIQSFLAITFTELEENEIDKIFPMETFVVIYNNNDEVFIPGLIVALNNSEHNIRSINAFANSQIGMPLPAEHLALALDMPQIMVEQMLTASGVTSMSMLDFLTLLNQTSPDPLLASQLEQMIAGRRMLIGENYSRMMVEVGYFPDSETMTAFLDYFDDLLTQMLPNQFYLVGSAPLSRELRAYFSIEYLIISIVLSVALYVVLFISYRKFLLPLILIGIVQTAMWIMMSSMMITGIPIYFLALLIVQSVIKGSALEWGVLLTNSYIEARKTCDKQKALTDAIKKSGRVTMTSSLIMVVVTVTLGLVMSGAVSSIMMGMGIASLAAAILTLFALPSFLVVFDRFVVSKKCDEDIKQKMQEKLN